MSTKHVGWLYEELPGLVGRGVISAEAAERLRQHYGAVERGGGRRWALLVFSVLGSALIGAGIILLLAHNWDQLGRPVRAVLSFVPLAAALGLAGFVLAKRAASAAWREGVGTFWALAIGATISLVAQTYHISGDFGTFLLTWTLVGLPIIYLLGSSVAAMLYLIGVTAWAGDASGYGDLALWFWALAALAVPHLWLVMRDNRYGGRAALLLWVLTVCLPFGIGFSLSGPAAKAWPLLYTAYFATLYLGGNLWFGEGRTFGQRPLQTVGALGVIVLSIALTFEGVWEHLIEPASWLAVGHSPLALWPLASFALWGYTWTRRDPVALLVGALPVVVLIGSLLLAIPADPAVLVLMNLYVLGLGVALLGLGIRDHRLGVVNLGLLVTSALIVARFFDSDLGFVLRGLAFIAVGAGFLVTNIVLLRRARGGA